MRTEESGGRRGIERRWPGKREEETELIFLSWEIRWFLWENGGLVLSVMSALRTEAHGE